MPPLLQPPTAELQSDSEVVLGFLEDLFLDVAWCSTEGQDEFSGQLSHMKCCLLDSKQTFLEVLTAEVLFLFLFFIRPSEAGTYNIAEHWSKSHCVTKLAH